MKTLAQFFFIILGLLSTQMYAAEQLVVVAGAKSAISNLTREQTAALFLGKSIQLPNGNTPVLTDLPENAPVREHFYLSVTEKSVALAKAGWTRLVFSGKASRPKESATSAEVKKFVASNPDALGYIEKSAVDSTVKIVYTVE